MIRMLLDFNCRLFVVYCNHMVKIRCIKVPIFTLFLFFLLRVIITHNYHSVWLKICWSPLTTEYWSIHHNIIIYTIIRNRMHNCIITVLQCYYLTIHTYIYIYIRRQNLKSSLKCGGFWYTCHMVRGRGQSGVYSISVNVARSFTLYNRLWHF